MTEFHLTVSTPNGHAARLNAIRLTLRGALGDMAILADHAPIMTAILPGECRITASDGNERIGRTESGILSVWKNQVTLLTERFAWQEGSSNADPFTL